MVLQVPIALVVLLIHCKSPLHISTSAPPPSAAMTCPAVSMLPLAVLAAMALALAASAAAAERCPGPKPCGTCPGLPFNLSTFCYTCDQDITPSDPIKATGMCKGMSDPWLSCCTTDPAGDPGRGLLPCAKCYAGSVPCDPHVICPPWTPPPTPPPPKYRCVQDKCVESPAGESGASCATSCGPTTLYSCKRDGFANVCKPVVQGGVPQAECEKTCQLHGTGLATLSRGDGDPASCTTDRHCALLGSCVDGRCACDAGWTGADCSRASLKPLNLANGYQPTGGTSSWGGRPIQYNGTWHLLCSQFTNLCPLSRWTHNSVVARATSPSPGGPVRTSRHCSHSESAARLHRKLTCSACSLVRWPLHARTYGLPSLRGRPRFIAVRVRRGRVPRVPPQSIDCGAHVRRLLSGACVLRRLTCLCGSRAVDRTNSRLWPVTSTLLLLLLATPQPNLMDAGMLRCRFQLFMIGVTNASNVLDCTKSVPNVTTKGFQAVAGQIDMAWSTSPMGPWKR